jgi:hypothetical protein
MLPHSALESGRYFSKAYLEFCNLNAALLAPCGGAGGARPGTCRFHSSKFGSPKEEQGVMTEEQNFK